MRFADIPAHQYEKSRLRAMADEGRLPHALLLQGPSGIGKFALARAFAQYIHCTDRTPEGDSCGRCNSCRQHERMGHIDTFYSFPVLKKDGPTLSRDFAREWADFLQESMYMDFDLWLSKLGNTNGQPAIYKEEAVELVERLGRTPRQSQYKIVLMWLPERMNNTVANKLLKLIEEPAGDTLFIMTSDNPAEILPTIYSRTQRIDVHPYPDAVLQQILQQGGTPAAQAAVAASLAEGSVVRALKGVGGADANTDAYLELFKELMRKGYARKIGLLRSWADDVAKLRREGAMRFFEYCARMVRENFIYNIRDARLNNMSADEAEFGRRFSPFINVVNVEDMLRVFTAARNATAANGNVKIIAFDLAIKIILLIKRGQ